MTFPDCLTKLPDHPLPEAFEAFPTFLIRLAFLNGLSSTDAIALSLFPTESRRTIRSLSWFGRINYGGILQATNNTSETLRATTPFYLATKFARSTHPQAVSKFLSGIIIAHRRWCSVCLADYKYHQLCWQFDPLIGCIEHDCMLLDRCPHCKAKIPILKVPFDLTLCSVCGGLLTDAEMVPLSLSQLVEAQHWRNLIEFLLSPTDWEDDALHVVTQVGRDLLALRMTQGLSVDDLSQLTGISTNSIEGIERGVIRNKGARLLDYIVYSKYFGLSINKLLNEASHKLPNRELETLRAIRLSALRAKITHAIVKLHQEGRPLTHKNVALAAKISRRTICNYPEIKQLLKEAKQRINDSDPLSHTF